MTIAIIGGTGTLGTCLIERLYGKEKLICFSRDELKQSELRQRFPDVKYIIGDIRDKSSLRPVMEEATTVFHVAALKQVPCLEDNPLESVKTNILGTVNVAEEAMRADVSHVVFSSTDKAVLPINVYGMSKGLAESYLFSLNRKQLATRFSVFKWANVLGSRGSVIPIFAKSLAEHNGVQITDPRMTRFWINIEDAVTFMLENFKAASLSDCMIPDMKASTVMELAEALAKLMGKDKFQVHFTGIRPGEKIHECLYSSHDHCIRSDTAERLTQDELIAMLRRVV